MAGIVWVLVGAGGAPADEDALALRLEQVTRPLLGARYLRSPLGEGAPPDGDPRLRRDGFDCTTFVETAIALASVSTASGDGALADALDRLRYDGAVSYQNRRHLPESQWLPGLSRLGVLEEATAAMAGGSTASARLVLSPEVWRRRRVARDLLLAEDRVPAGVFLVPYVPLAQLPELYRRLPPGTLLSVVRRPTPSAPTLITHQALLLARADGTRFVRHASAALGRVADQTPEQFHRLLAQPKRWPILGVNLQRVRALTHRRRRRA